MTAILLGIITALLEVISPSAPAATPPLASVVIRGSSVYDAPALFVLYRGIAGLPEDDELRFAEPIHRLEREKFVCVY